MKTQTALVPIARYRNEEGRPVCGEMCLMLDIGDKRFGCCTHSTTEHYPGPTCPIWQPGVTVIGEEMKL